MLQTLREIIKYEDAAGHGAAAFNVFGYEDAAAVISAAEQERRSVILMANKDAINHMPPEILGPLLINLAQRSSTPVGVHLDHATDLSVIRAAIDAGFTSVMFDGSQLSFEENAELTKQVVAIAEKKGVSVEAEIGAVGYSDPAISFQSAYTEPEDARAFVDATHVDALAVAVGTVHRMLRQTACLQFDRLLRIRGAVAVPLVIHGSSGVADGDLTKLVAYGAKKINLGTTLRLAFGQELRRQFDEDPAAYDRIKLFPRCMAAVQEKALEKIRLI